MGNRIGVIGGGSWGTALAILLANKEKSVDIWLRNGEQAVEIANCRENKKYLPGIKIPENLNINSDIEKTIYKKDVLILATSSHGIRSVLEENKSLIKKEQILVNVAKGIENDTLMRISEVANMILPMNRYVVLSGPTHAEEVARDIPSTIVSASKDKLAAEYIQDLFMTPNFRVYTNPDVLGVELGGSLKNVIALAAGISDGLGYGDNTKAALMTRGIFEMSRLGENMGASLNTFSGLAGIGDLIVTCTSMLSRNRKAGILIGKGYSVEDAMTEVGMVVESIRTTKSAYMLSKRYNVEMPITEELFNVLYNKSSVMESVPNLMNRGKKHEMGNNIFNEGLQW